MKRDHSSPQAYRDDVDGKLSLMLETIRELVLEVCPASNETIEYGMLGYPGIGNLAAQKHYVALYVAPEVLDSHRSAFADCGKSCIRFRHPDQIDESRLRTLLADLREANA